MGFLLDFSKLFGRKIISYFLWIYIYCFLFSLDSNFFICSYLKIELSNIENNMHFVLLSLIIYIIYKYNINSKFNLIQINNFLTINYYISLLKEQNILTLIKTFINNIFIKIINIFNIYNNKFLFNNILFIYINIKDSLLVWYPIYKSYSIFGYYKSTRLKFIDFKNENLKRFKY